MKRLLLLLLIVFITIPFYAQTVYEYYVDGQIYFKLNDDQPVKLYENGVVPLDELEILRTLNRTYQITGIKQPFYRSGSPVLERTFQLEFSDLYDVDKIVRELEKFEVIEYAEKVALFINLETANDPNFNPTYNWHLFHIGAEEAWDFSKGSKDIVIAVTDDAVWMDHPDLKANIWTNPNEIPNNNIDDDKNGYIDDIHGWDAGSNDNNPNPNAITTEWTHGTHVAGIAGSVTNNGIDNASISYNCSIMAVKGTDTQPSKYVETFGMVTYAAKAGADVINMSWGSPSYTTTGQNVINYAHSKGCVLVSAAGNHGTEAVWYPAGYNHVISVTNTDNNDKKYSSAAYGSKVDLSAPGYQINSSATTPSGSGSATGTSQSAPLVSGLCGLMLSFNPNLTNDEVEQILKQTSVNIDALNPQYAGKLGTGRINAKAAMAQVATTISLLDAGISAVSGLEETMCSSGNITPIATLRNYGTINLTSVTINYSLDGGAAQSTPWNGNLAPGQEVNVSLPAMNLSAGKHDLKAFTTKPNNNTDGRPSNDEQNIQSFLYSVPGSQIPFTEEFTGGAFPPTGWLETNGWKLSSAGYPSSSSAYIDNYNGTVGTKYELTLPNIDLTSSSAPELNFHYASVMKGTKTDKLRVLVSSNCGETWSMRFFKSGSTLVTAPASNSPFTPANSDWTEAKISLLPYKGMNNVLIKLEFTSGGGNNFYADNFNISEPAMSIRETAIEGVKIYPNPSKGRITIESHEPANKVNIYSIAGKLMYSENTNGLNNLFINTELLSAGVYMVEVQGDGWVMRERVIVVE